MITGGKICWPSKSFGEGREVSVGTLRRGGTKGDRLPVFPVPLIRTALDAEGETGFALDAEGEAPGCGDTGSNRSTGGRKRSSGSPGGIGART